MDAEICCWAPGRRRLPSPAPDRDPQAEAASAWKVMDLKAACRTFKSWWEERKVAAALLLE